MFLSKEENGVFWTGTSKRGADKIQKLYMVLRKIVSLQKFLMPEYYVRMFIEFARR